MTAPVPFRWEGDAFRPLPTWGKRCDDLFVIGQVYPLVEHKDRSLRSHNHYFACIEEAWAQMLETRAAEFPTPEHLRKYALIKAGYANRHDTVTASQREALALAALFRSMDEYSLAEVRERVVTVWRPHSQSMKAMGKKDFQASKDAVLGIVAEMIGTTPAALTDNAGKAA